MIEDYESYLDIEAVRERLRTMPDKKLIEFGKACRSLLANRLKAQSEEPWKTQLELAKEEWRRRYPKA